MADFKKLETHEILYGQGFFVEVALTQRDGEYTFVSMSKGSYEGEDKKYDKGMGFSVQCIDGVIEALQKVKAKAER